MASLTISLCMIVKNEEDLIDQCLTSVNDVVDEMIIVDTGSTDRTIDICKKYNPSIYSYQWQGNFSEARNFGITKASSDWILILDADEKLESNSNEVIRKTIEHTKASILLLPVINYYGEGFPVKEDQAYLYYQPRLFKNHVGIQYSNSIHENPQLHGNDTQELITEQIETPIHHYGYIDEIINKKEKSKRNIDILLKEYKKNKHSPWIEYHLANEFYRQSKFEIAFDYVNESIFGFLLQGIKPPAILYRLKYDILVQTNSIDGAYPAIDKAIDLYPDYVDLHYIKGILLFHKKQYSEALACFEKCLELGENHPRYLILKGTGSFRALYFKEKCLKMLNT